MNNKLFAGLIFSMVLFFFGWMYHDWKNSSSSAQKDGVIQDFLSDSRGGEGAGVQYVFRFSEPVYSHALSTSQIETLSQSGGEAEHYHVYGLTQADFSNDTVYEVSWSKKWFKDEYKLWVDNLRVEFTYDTLNVYVTNNYSEGSCEYQATLEHENQHVDIHRRLYFKYQKIFQDVMNQWKDIPLKSNPVTATSVEEGKHEIGDKISTVLDPVFNQFKAELQQEQGGLDTPENYEVLKEKCQNW
jgi:hypothetical protein